VAHVLRTDGSLAIIHTHALAGGAPGLFEAVQPLYECHLGDEPDFTLPSEVDASGDVQGLETSGYFETPDVRVYDVETDHDGQSYSGLLSTFSPMLALPDDSDRSSWTISSV
jgi:hypothetical protein